MQKNKIKLKYYFGELCCFIKNPNFQTIVLVILVITNTLMVSNLLRQLKDQECFFCSNKFSNSNIKAGLNNTGANLKIEKSQFRAIDGVIVEKGQATSSRPLAVIIENHFEARPQTGLAEANLVYEFLTEGGITRFLAFYDSSSTIEKIGPIRSCRPYFLNVAEEFQSIFAHVGGSPDCLDLLKKQKYNVYNLDEYSKTDYFWRSQDRFAPHNVYTSIGLLNQYLNDKEIDIQSNFEPWKFKTQATPEQLSGLEPSNINNTFVYTSAEKIQVNFSTYTYNVEWHYNKKTNNYNRYVAGEIHESSNSKEVKAENIIIQFVKARLLDSIGRLSFNMESRGDAIIFQDGQAIEGYWKKPDRASRTRFYSPDNQEIVFNPGSTWVEVLPTDRDVSWE